MVAADQRGYAKGRATRESILDVATRVFAEVGYNGASLREIAAQCGLTHPGLIHHFPTKSALLAAVLERRDAQDTERFALADDAGLDLFERLVELVAHNETQPHLVELHAALSGEATAPNHPAHQYFVERYRMLRAGMAQGVRRAQADGRIRPDLDPEATATALGALMDGLQVQWLMEPDSIDMSGVFAAVLGRLLDLPAEPARETVAEVAAAGAVGASQSPTREPSSTGSSV